MDRIVVVGASLAGLRAVEALRRKGFAGSITLIGDEKRTPYDRPPLSKEVLRGEWEAERVDLRRKGYDDLNLDLRLGKRATKLDTAARFVELEGGERVAYDGLLLTCGTVPRKLPNQPDLPGVFMLRTLDDALAMRDALTRKPRVAVIGAGFIGSEVAASCVKLGLPVTVIEALPVPLSRSLGPKLGEVLAELHRKNGVDLRLGAAVAAIEGAGKVERVVLGDGSVIPCDVLCVGIGVAPSVDWLEGSGLALDNGVVCDEYCETNVKGVYAAGDVANWMNPLFGERMRVEHWTNAVEQAKVAAENLLAGDGPRQAFASAPMFWSDQYGIKIQGAGRPKATDTIHLCHGTPADGSFTALYGREGRLVGVVTFQQPAKLFQYRKMIVEKASWEAALEAAAK
ncbi:MAG: FAD-dependent oxidoreductase [Polyangiales bacterium]